jgi:hypothetical protein
LSWQKLAAGEDFNRHDNGKENKLMNTAFSSWKLLFTRSFIISIALAFAGCGSGGNGTGSPESSQVAFGATSTVSYYVAPNGSDANPGTITQPYLTIQKCATTVASGSACQIRAGTYHETVTPNSGVIITSYNGEMVTVDGTDSITGWTNYQGSIWSASVPASGVFGSGDTNQVFVGQQMMTEARWPNGDDLFHINWATAQTGTSSTQLVDSNLPNINWAGAKIHFWSGTDPWVTQTGTVSASQSNQLTFSVDGASTSPYIIPMAGGYYYLFGTLGALDTEREWFYDTAGVLYFWAPAGADPNTLDVRTKQRQYAFDLSGKSNVTIRNIKLFASTINSNASSTNNIIDGITATYVSHYTTLPDKQGYPSSYWNEHISDSGIIINGTGNVLQNSTISNSAGNGITVMGSNNIVRNNLIHHIDYMANLTSGIALFGTGHMIQHNTIYATGRTSIAPNSLQNIPPNNNDISYNNLFNAMMMSRDGGAIYAPALAVTGTRIHHNWIHDTQSLYSGPASNYPLSGVYLDGDTNGWQVDQNVFWNNQYYNIYLHGSALTAPNNNNISNNSVIDVGLKANILLNDIPTCGSTQIVNNFVLLSVAQTLANCTETNNNSTAPGATEMTSAVTVGCNFTGCFSSGPPILSGGAVSASVATQPYNLTVSVGQTATFSVTGVGSGPLNYQWQKNSTNITGATAASYTTPVTTSADNGAVFTVNVSNSVGGTNSNLVTLTVR